VLQVATDVTASGIWEFLLDFPSPRHLSSSGSYPLVFFFGLGDPSGSNATAGLGLRVTGTHKPLYHGKVEIPKKGVNVILFVSGKETFPAMQNELFPRKLQKCNV
jgi:hypothetical protein